MKKNRGGNVSLKQAMGMMNQRNTILVDVKSEDEYAQFHLNRSINMPIENFKKMVPKVIKNKNQRVILYCSSGTRSLAAYEMLIDMGYYYVYNIAGGVE